jgi:hypothetical protein
MTYLLPSERVRLQREAAVRPGQKFVLVDTAVPGGEWVDGIIYDSSREADREAEKLRGRHPRIQVIDAVWYGPSEAKLKALGMRAAADKVALNAGTLRAFRALASSKLTQYDERLQAKQPNNYRLGHYFGALERAEKDVLSHYDLDDDSPEALNAFKSALLRRSTSSGGRSDLPPIRNVIKQIDAFLATGQLPSLTRKAADEDLLPVERKARFSEGPEGEKEWKEWFADQPESFQKEWKDQTDAHAGEFIEESMMSKTDDAFLLPVEVEMHRMARPDSRAPVASAKAARLQGEALYAALKKIVDEKQHAKINGQMVDLFSASAMVQVADALNEKNRERFLSLPLTKAHAMTFRMLKTGSANDMLPVEKAARRVEAASGLYGYTKRTQHDVEASIRKAQVQAAKIASFLVEKDDQSIPFLKAHAKRARSTSARLLLAAMKSMGPKVAAKVASGDRTMTASQESLYDTLWFRAAEDTEAREAKNAALAVQNAWESAEGDRNDYRTIKDRLASDLASHWSHQDRTAAGKVGGIGLYGFPTKTARRCLSACADFRSYVGEVAYSLHSRREAKWDHITGFMREHSKTARCGYTRLLLGCYPDSPAGRMASEETVKVAKSKVIKKFGPADVSKVTKSNGDEYFRVGWSNQSWTFSTEKEALDFAKKNEGAFKAFDEAAKRGVQAGELPEALKKHQFGKGDGGDKDEKKDDKGKKASEVEAKRKAPPKEHQFTSENNPNPKGNDRDGDGKTNEAKPFDEEGKKAAAPQGNAQKAILEYLDGHKGEVLLTDMSRDSRFRGIHFAKIMGAMEDLAKKGLIHHRSQKGEGDFLRKKASLPDAWGPTLVNASFDPNQIGALEPGALISEADETYMGENFTEQEGGELQMKQESGVLQDGMADAGEGKMASSLVDKAKKLHKQLDKGDPAKTALQVELLNIAESDNATTRARLENAIQRAEKALSKMASTPDTVSGWLEWQE